MFSGLKTQISALYMDEGYIKFQAHWTKTPPLSYALIDQLNHWRQEMYQRGFIGAYPNGIGFGNISHRFPQEEQFLISGSTTGNIEQLTAAHYAKVTAVDVDKNTLYCEGNTIASSESMSHAVIYQTCPTIRAVIHVHHLAMWKKLLHQVPTTDLSATYGTPEMAHSIIHLLKTTNLLEKKIFVMEGHEEGIFVFGRDLASAAETLYQYT